MAIYRATNNKKAYGTQPQELIKKNEHSGEVMFAYDTIVLGIGGVGGASAVANGDIVYLSKLPAHSKVLRVKAFVEAGTIAAADINIGYSSSEVVGDKDATVAAVTNAFIDDFDPNAAASDDMAVTDAGFLVELEKDVFITAEFVAAPATQTTAQVIGVIVEYVSK